MKERWLLKEEALYEICISCGGENEIGLLLYLST
jgi:hypothetical protein